MNDRSDLVNSLSAAQRELRAAWNESDRAFAAGRDVLAKALDMLAPPEPEPEPPPTEPGFTAPHTFAPVARGSAMCSKCNYRESNAVHIPRATDPTPEPEPPSTTSKS